MVIIITIISLSVIGVLSWLPARDITSLSSHLYDALDVINAGITDYLSSHSDLGSIPSECGIRKLDDPNGPYAFLAQSKWWQHGIDLYE